MDHVFVALPWGIASLAGSLNSSPVTRKDPNFCAFRKSPGARLNPPNSSLVRVAPGVQRQPAEKKWLWFGFVVLGITSYVGSGTSVLSRFHKYEARNTFFVDIL